MKIQNRERRDWFILEKKSLKIVRYSCPANFHQLKSDVQIKLKSGREVNLPSNFEILTIKNGNLVPKKVKEVQKGDLIAMPRKLPSNNSYQKLDVETPLKIKLHIIPRLPSTINESLAYFLGIVSSDGYIRRDGKIVLTNTNEAIIKNFQDLVRKLFNLKTGKIPVEIRKDGKILRWVHTLLYSKAVKKYLMVNFKLKEGKKNEYIRVPRLIFRSPRKVIAYYLRGVFDGDGSLILGRNSIVLKLTAKNRKFALDIQELLLFFGIIAYVRPARNLWEVVISNRINIKKFLKEIGFIHPEKLRKTQIAITKKKYVPIKIGKIIRKERERCGISLRALSKETKIKPTTLQHYENDDCLPKADTLLRIAKLLNSEKLTKIAESSKYEEYIRKKHQLSGWRKTTNDDVLPPEIARRCILEIKEKYGISQEKIAKAIGSSQGRIGNYERGDTSISFFTIKKLDKIFPTPLTSLIANSHIFWDRVIKVKQSSSEIIWPKIKKFVYYNRIIARWCK